MKLCDLTLPTPEENLACDEVLLDLCEAGGSDEVLRFWAPPQYFVVVGYANKAATEVNLPVCRELVIPVLRRCTGGGTVLQGPGVLNYSLILRIDESAQFRYPRSSLDSARGTGGGSACPGDCAPRGNGPRIAAGLGAARSEERRVG